MRRVVVLLVVIGMFTTSSEASRTYSKKGSDKTGGGYIIYQVKRGDSLSVLAKRFNTTTKKLISINKLKKSTLMIGQSLVVPSSRKVTKRVKKEKISKKHIKKFIKYRVDKGDTIAYIAKRFHITKKEVALLNGLNVRKLPKAGRILKIPNYQYWSSSRERLRDLKLNSVGDVVRGPSRPKIYVVKSGDTLFSIARKYKTSINELMKINNIGSKKYLRVGQRLKIPAKSYSQIGSEEIARKSSIDINSIEKKSRKRGNKDRDRGEVSGDRYYTVKKGDSLKKIAKKNGISIKELMALNGLTANSRLSSGKKLLVKREEGEKKEDKKSSKRSKKVEKYTVKSGDSLWSIAKKYKISVKELRRLNNLTDKDILLRGMVLVVKADKDRSRSDSKRRSVKSVKVAKKSVKSVKRSTKSVKKSHKSKKSRVRVAKKRKDDDIKVVLRKRGKGYKFGKRVSVNNIIRTAKRYLGTRYVWGAEGPKGFDCSGFTQYVMRKSKGIRLPRVSRRQAYYGKYVRRKDLRPGDLIFFDTSRRRRGYVNHVGIYIGNNKFIHASSARHRVVITSLNSPFYRARFKWGRRVN